jgi:hypothetical protein
MTGGKAWTREKVMSDLRLERIRARAAREVRGVWRRVNLRKGALEV